MQEPDDSAHVSTFYVLIKPSLPLSLSLFLFGESLSVKLIQQNFSDKCDRTSRKIKTEPGFTCTFYRDTKKRRIEKSSVIFLRNPILSLTKYGEQKNKITKLTPREILELFVDDVARTISREYSFLLLKILRRHRTDRDLTTRNIIYYRDNL